MLSEGDTSISYSENKTNTQDFELATDIQVLANENQGRMLRRQQYICLFKLQCKRFIVLIS
jgi:hypothetical protein